MSAFWSYLTTLRRSTHAVLHTCATWVKNIWDSSVVAWLLIAITVYMCYRWLRHTPFPGYAIAFIAFIAAAISIRDNTPIQKVLWISAIGVLLRVEFKAIRFDREGTAREQQHRFDAQQEKFKGVADRIDISIANNDTNFGKAAKTANQVLISANGAAKTAGRALDEITGRNGFPYVIPVVEQQSVHLLISASGPDMLTNVTVSISRMPFSEPGAQHDLLTPPIKETVGNLHQHVRRWLNTTLKPQLEQDADVVTYIIVIDTQLETYDEWIRFKPTVNKQNWTASYTVQREEYSGSDRFAALRRVPFKTGVVEMPVCGSKDMKAGKGFDGKPLKVPVCGEP